MSTALLITRQTLLPAGALWPQVPVSPMPDYVAPTLHTALLSLRLSAEDFSQLQNIETHRHQALQRTQGAQAVPNEKLLPEEHGESDSGSQREAGAFRFIMSSNQGREEVKIPLFSSQSLSQLVHIAPELGREKELWTRHQGAWVSASLCP